MSASTLLTLVLALSFPKPHGDWPQWRGPHRNGVIKDLDVPKDWPEKLTEKWQLEVGEGHSSPLVDAGLVFCLSRVGEAEVVRCLRLEDGSPEWEKSYPAPYKMHSSAHGHGKGPKSTPAYYKKHLVTFGISGILSCWNSDNGDLKWRKDFSDLYQTTSPLYGASQSPLINRGLCYIHVGGHDDGAFSVFRLSDGKPGWRWFLDGPAYSSPVYSRMAQREYLIFQSQNSLAGFDIQTGQPLWRKDFTTPYDQNSVSPTIYRDWIIYSGLKKGIHAIRMNTRRPFEPEVLKVWSNNDKHLYMSSPVVWRSLLFGMSPQKKGHIFCMSVKKGKVLWEGPGRLGDNAALVSTRTAIFVLTTAGKLLVLEPNDAGYNERASYDVSPTPTWAHPAFVDDRILVKDRDTLRCYSWR